MKHYIPYLSLTVIYLLLFSCSKKQAAEMKPTPVPPEKPGTTVTYTNFAQALFQTKCARCHGVGRGAAAIWTFDGLASVSSNQNRIRQSVLVSKSMPLGGSLSAAELKSLQEWFDNKMPE